MSHVDVQARPSNRHASAIHRHSLALRAKKRKKKFMFTGRNSHQLFPRHSRDRCCCHRRRLSFSSRGTCGPLYLSIYLTVYVVIHIWCETHAAFARDEWKWRDMSNRQKIFSLNFFFSFSILYIRSVYLSWEFINHRMCVCVNASSGECVFLESLNQCAIATVVPQFHYVCFYCDIFMHFLWLLYIYSLRYISYFFFMIPFNMAADRTKSDSLFFLLVSLVCALCASNIRE